MQVHFRNESGFPVRIDGHDCPPDGTFQLALTDRCRMDAGDGTLELVLRDAARLTLDMVLGPRAWVLEPPADVAALEMRIGKAAVAVWYVPQSGQPRQAMRDIGLRPASPDSVYPLPAHLGQTDEQGVNLLTGQVAQRFNLATIMQDKLAWHLDALYNSASAMLGTQAQDNALNGAGWKLMDYPKIVEDGKEFFLLDGMAAHPLALLRGDYVGCRQYQQWAFQRLADGGWTVTDDHGLRYTLANRGQLAGGQTVWHLSRFGDTAWPGNAIAFTYTGNQLKEVRSSAGDGILLAYQEQDGRLASVVWTVQTQVGDSQVDTLVRLLKLGFDGTEAQALSSIDTDLMKGIGECWSEGGYAFAYTRETDGPPLLRTVRRPQGLEQEYRYDSAAVPVPGGYAIKACRVAHAITRPGGGGERHCHYRYRQEASAMDADGAYLLANAVQTAAAPLRDDAPFRLRLFFNGLPGAQLMPRDTEQYLANWPEDRLAELAESPAAIGLAYLDGEFAPPQPQPRQLLTRGWQAAEWAGGAVRPLRDACEQDAAWVLEAALAVQPGAEAYRIALLLLDETCNTPVACVELETGPRGQQGPVTASQRFPLAVRCGGYRVVWADAHGRKTHEPAFTVLGMQIGVIDVGNNPGAYGDSLPLPSGSAEVDLAYTLDPAAGLPADLGDGWTALAVVCPAQGGEVAAVRCQLGSGSQRWHGTGLTGPQGGETLALAGPAGQRLWAEVVAQEGPGPVWLRGRRRVRGLAPATLHLARPLWLTRERGKLVKRDGHIGCVLTELTRSMRDGVSTRTAFHYRETMHGWQLKAAGQMGLPNPSRDAPRAEIKTATEFSYAWEQQEAMLKLNLVSALSARTPMLVTPGMPNKPAGPGLALRWRNWGTDQAPAWDVDEIRPEDGGPALRILARNRHGKPTLTQCDGVPDSVVYDSVRELLEVARFHGADLAAGDAAYISFADHHGPCGMVREGGEVRARQGYTAPQALCGKDLRVRLARAPVAAGDHYQFSAYVRLEPDGSCELAAGGTLLARLDGQSGAWRHVQAIVTGAMLAQGLPELRVSHGAIDHALFAPASAEFSITVWNVPLRRPVARIEPNGRIFRTFLDGADRPLAQCVPGHGLALVTQHYGSVQGNYWFNGVHAFSDSEPNMEFRIRSRLPGVWDDFSRDHGVFATPQGASRDGESLRISRDEGMVASGCVVEAQAMVPLDGRAASFAAVLEVLSGPDAGGAPSASIDAGFVPLPATAGLSLFLENNGMGRKLVLGLCDDAFVLMDSCGMMLRREPVRHRPPAVVLTAVVHGGRHLLAYANGRFLFRLPLHSGERAAALGLWSGRPDSAFHNFGFVPDPELSLSTFDGAGTEQQFLSTVNAAASSLSRYRRQGAATQTQHGTVDDADLAPMAADAPPPQPSRPGAANGRQLVGGAPDSDPYFGFDQRRLAVHAQLVRAGLSVFSFGNPDGVVFGRVRVDQADSANRQCERFEYDNAFRLRRHLYTGDGKPDSAAHVLEYDYDGAGRVIRKADPDGGETQYFYDESGRLRCFAVGAADGAWPRRGVFIHYDALGRETARGVADIAREWRDQPGAFSRPGWPEGGQVRRRLTWDLPNAGEPHTLGRITCIATSTEGGGAPVEQRLRYDVRGNVIRMDTTAGGVASWLEFDYDGLDQRIAVHGEGGYQVRYDYDNQGRIIAIGDGANPVRYAQYRYQKERVQEILDNGRLQRNYYLGRNGKITRIDDPYFREELYFGTRRNGAKGYDDGRIASIHTRLKKSGGLPELSLSEEFSYDAFGRLVKADRVQEAAPQGGVWESSYMCYDAFSNLLSLHAKGGEGGAATSGLRAGFRYNAGRSRLVEAYGDVTTGQGTRIWSQSCEYDDGGNQAYASVLPLEGAHRHTCRYTYDPMTGQLARGERSGDSVQFGYDGGDRRVLRTVCAAGNTEPGAGQTSLLLRGTDGTVWLERHAGAPLAGDGHIHGPLGRIALHRLDSGHVDFLLCDHIGSTRVVVRGETVKARFCYSQFGALVEQLSVLPPADCRCDWRYTGQRWDSVLQWYDFPARFYDPAIARFVQVDPLHEFGSPYAYAPDPVNFNDPSGEWTGWDDAIAFGIGVVIGGGLEVARQLLNGESINWKRVALGAAIGGACAWAALYTGGASLAGMGSGAAGLAAGGTVLKGVAVGAALGAGMGGGAQVVSNKLAGRSWNDGLGKAMLSSAVSGGTGALYGFGAGALVGAAFGGGTAITGAALERMAQGALRSGLTSVTSGIVSGKRWDQVLADGAQAAATGALKGLLHPQIEAFKADIDGRLSPYTNAGKNVIAGVWKQIAGSKMPPMPAEIEMTRLA